MGIDNTQWKIYEMQAEILKALAHPIRLAIANLLRDGEMCVCDIAEQVGAGRSNVSRHLAVMLHAGVLECRKDGLRMMYSLRTPCVLECFSCVSDVLRERVEAEGEVLKQL
ncbi:MAG: metalloregulator ArsR/SmtB family transcription factor [Candidatus Brocadiaceae bacterium]|jgi:ArsR family transcriptional regulator